MKLFVLVTTKYCTKKNEFLRAYIHEEMPQISFLKQKSLFTYLRFRLKKCLQLPTTTKDIYKYTYSS